MAERDISGATTTDFENQVDNFEIQQVTTDGAQEYSETYYTNDNWSKHLGYYNGVIEFKGAIDALVDWSVGKGYESDETTALLLERITGFGKDKFCDVFRNLAITAEFSGDAYAEIITDDDGYLINLKPLDPSSIRIVANRKGIIKRYEQVAKVGEKKRVVASWKPEEIFHLCNERIADEIHGLSKADAVETYLLFLKEAVDDWRQVLHRNVKPIIMHHVDTDNASEISDYETKINNAYNKGEHIVVPKNNVETTEISVAPNSTMNPIPTLQWITDKLYEVMRVPKVIVGSSGNFTDASSKTTYLAFQQTVKTKQRFYEEQILAQLNLEIKFLFPASLEQGLLSEKNNEDGVQVNPPQSEPVQGIEQNDVTAEAEGVR